MAEWAVYFRIEPDPDLRADTLSAQGLAILANINRGKDVDPFDPTDFMPWVEKPKQVEVTVDPEQNQVELLAAFGYREN